MYTPGAEGSNDSAHRFADEVVSSLQQVIYTLDGRWSPSSKKPPAVIIEDHTFYQMPSTDSAIRLASKSTADLFGTTSASLAAAKLIELAGDTRNLPALQERLGKLHARTAIAYERLLDLLLIHPATLRIEWAGPLGEQNAAELNVHQLQAGFSYLNETIEKKDMIHFTGSLITMNTAKRRFRMESEEGVLYKGGLSDTVRQQYPEGSNTLAFPVRAEASIERRTIYKPRLDREAITDTLVELDTHPGLDIQETLFALRELYNRLASTTGSDSDYAFNTLISMDDYSELAALVNQLLDSNPSKGARRALDPADLPAVYELLTAGRPIGNLAEFDTRLVAEDQDGYDSGSRTVGRAEREKAAAALLKLTTAAYPYIRMLLKRLLRMIDALEAADG
ncbi:hypothetical protein GCM10010911_14100 [Paenibacillus nasutitermitis]|uniref:Uncharacterized protein n=1 Tax=Paenibacillus nasutitermitis TaxID=1652958 RepID=A0A916YQV4_9BACL|nr:hypothetical protein GCM10010911_14100 [Paenibacillus nasutitermitis]